MLNNPQEDPTSVSFLYWLHLDLRNLYTCQHGLSSKTRTDSYGEILCKSEFQSPLSLPKIKQPNVATFSKR